MSSSERRTASGSKATDRVGGRRWSYARFQCFPIHHIDRPVKQRRTIVFKSGVTPRPLYAPQAELDQDVGIAIGTRRRAREPDSAASFFRDRATMSCRSMTPVHSTKPPPMQSANGGIIVHLIYATEKPNYFNVPILVHDSGFSHFQVFGAALCYFCVPVSPTGQC
jgi:hypothetical protein